MNASETESEEEEENKQNPPQNSQNAQFMQQTLDLYSSIYDMWRASRYKFVITTDIERSSQFMVKNLQVINEETLSELVIKEEDGKPNKFDKNKLLQILLKPLCNIDNFQIE
jgi:hypothetical protein